MLRIKIGKFALVWRPEPKPRSGRRVALAFLLLATLVYAGVPHTFKDGDTLTATQLNENFAALSAKFDAMEGKSWRLIYETDVASATDTVSITGLNGNLDYQYMISGKILNTSGSSASYFLRPNGDVTAANYGYQYVEGSATGPAAVNRVTSNSGLQLLFGTSNNRFGAFYSILHAKTGSPRILLNLNSYDITTTTIAATNIVNSVWSDTSANITNMSIQSSVANGIGAGSHIEIWARR